jgi:hypothetical protein
MPTAAAVGVVHQAVVEVTHQAAAVAPGMHGRCAQLTAWAVRIVGGGLEVQRMAGH